MRFVFIVWKRRSSVVVYVLYELEKVAIITIEENLYQETQENFLVCLCFTKNQKFRTSYMHLVVTKQFKIY